MYMYSIPLLGHLGVSVHVHIRYPCTYVIIRYPCTHVIIRYLCTCTCTILSIRYPYEYDQTSSHQLRSSDDMQYSFSYFYYIIGETHVMSIDEVFGRLDTDLSGLGMGIGEWEWG